MYPYDAENGEMHKKSGSKLQVSGTSSESCCPGIFLPETDHELFKSYVQVQGGIGQGKGIHFV